ncbi:MAG TPA: Lrp/AsnC ligand binding domain-containing protein [Nitrosopumilaceae archaeon]|nr:Lrp/AsnC ligand binding domain-containing protein [Nitrosopumilaceae archaeon]
MKINSAYLLITCNVGKRDEVMTQIKHLNGIKYIQRTFGAYDIIARVESTTLDLLQRFITQKIRTLIDVRNAMTLHCKPNLESSDGKKRNGSTIETLVTTGDKLVTI